MQEYQLLQKSMVAEGHDENWTLVVPSEGEAYIEYSQSWSCPRRFGAANCESRFHSVSEFLESGDFEVRTRLLKLLDSLRINAPAQIQQSS
jgi:hypothetical protein